jgi:aldehyde:ferredoxin oxidoreductase
VVDEDCVELMPVGDLRGATSEETQHRLRERLGPDFAVAAIGLAGERLVRYATVSHDGRHAGRGGHGAVWGAKNLKAVAVRGERRCDWARPAELVQYSKELSRKSFGPATAKYRELGTVSNLLVFNRMAALPTRNFQQGTFEGAQQISPEQIRASREKAQKSCAGCTIGCEHIFSIEPGQQGKTVRLEYESLFALGPLCAIHEPDIVLAASHRCDELGIDTISTGATIAFAMECAERGFLDAPWLRFGDGAALLRAIDEIGCRQGIGDWLAEGSRRAAQRIGQGTIAFAPQVKGLEIPGYEPRALQTMALGFAVGTRGADHNRSGAYEVDFSQQVDRRKVGPEAAALAAETEDRAALMDSLILCKFLRGVFSDFFAEASHMLNLITGWNTSPEELRRTAQRIVTAKKLFNIQAGWQPEEDTLPERFLTAPLADDDRAQLSAERLAELVRAYNHARGWTPDGWVTDEILHSLELGEFCDPCIVSNDVV